jgi:hypothetical protein
MCWWWRSSTGTSVAQWERRVMASGSPLRLR